MKKRFLIFVLVLSITFIVINQSYAKSDWTGNANLTFGKPINNDPTRGIYGFGTNVDFGKKSWPVNIAIAFFKFKGSGDGWLGSVDTSATELRFGVKKIWHIPSTELPSMYLGGGLFMGDARHDWPDDSVESDEQSEGFGGWVNSGIFWTMGTHFNLGIDLVVSYGRFQDHMYGLETAGLKAALLLGYHW